MNDAALPTVEKLKEIETQLSPEQQAVYNEMAWSDAHAYDRKAMAMAHVLMIVRQRGDEIPNSFDMQNYDFFAEAGNNMCSPPRGAAMPPEASTRLAEDRSYDPAMAKIVEAVSDLRANAEDGLGEAVAASIGDAA